MVEIFAEIGFGNASFCSTEIEKGRFEHRIRGFVIPPKIRGIYVRIWLYNRVLVLSTRNMISWQKKPKKRVKKRVKILFGVEGVRG